eukprot:CAMPEP_0172167130 /NCGR_PEP_ID=MMETSP1050-20130122/9398_1 /TAXON_ID=233186 /ORGANISM="Cryptomonas curvata, Strain CCAP979/52" /LENGTH=199 /DNA_ID=CAMNT_0012837881 /DNA_START=69 /DNA_END=664 /DNA_ORIENTATION=+
MKGNFSALLLPLIAIISCLPQDGRALTLRSSRTETEEFLEELHRPAREDLLKSALSDFDVQAEFKRLGFTNLDGSSTAAAEEALFRAVEAGGDAPTQSALGTMFEEGISVKRNLTRAFALHSAAAADGDVAGLYNLAMMHLSGTGCERDAEAAARLLLLRDFDPKLLNFFCMCLYGRAPHDARLRDWLLDTSQALIDPS